MRLRLILYFIAIYSLFLCTPVMSMAISFSFHAYSGGIAESSVFYDADGDVIEEVVYFYSMDGDQYAASDIDAALGTGTWIQEFGDDWGDLAGGYCETTVYRGTRTFGEDTSYLSFGPEPGDLDWNSALSFVAADNSDYGIGEEFLLGTLTFTNAAWIVDSVPGEFTFSISASSEQVYGGEMQVFNGTILLYTNPNGVDPESDADWFYIQEEPGLGSVRVFESGDGDNTGSIEIWGMFGSLDLLEFRNPTDGAFLSDSITSDPSAPVPEPATVVLLSFGLLGLAGVNQRRVLKK